MEPDEKDVKIQELERKLGEQGKQLGEQREFIEGAQKVINVVAHHPDLRQKFQEEYKKVYESNSTVPSVEKKEEPEKKSADTKFDPRVEALNTKMTDVEMSRREEIISDFEARAGLSTLGEEEKSKMRKELEGYFRDFNQSIQTSPLSSLAKNLDKAHLSLKAERLREEGKLEGYAEALNNQRAAAPSMAGGTLIPEQGAGLTDAQRKYAEKLGVDVEKAKKTYMEREEEYKRATPIQKKSE